MVRLALWGFVVATAATSVGCNGPVRGAADQGGPPPLTVRASLARPVEADLAGEAVVRVRVEATKPLLDKRPPVNLAIVVDSSGSMEGGPIDEARKATQAMVDALIDGDRVAVVTFDSKVETVWASSELDRGTRAELRDEITSIRARGTTDLAGGLEAGLREVIQARREGSLDRIVVLGDGVPNHEPRVREVAQSAAAQGVAITALGLGDTYDEVLMGEMARTSGGRFFDVESPDGVAEIFKNEVTRMQSVRAKAVALQLVTGPGVTVRSVVGHDFTASEGGGSVHIGDLSAGDRRDVFVRLEVAPHAKGAMVELVDCVLSYQDSTGTAGEQRAFVGERAVDAAVARQRIDGALEQELAVAVASAAILEAMELARGGQREVAQELLRRATAEAQRVEDPSQALLELVEKMRGLVDDLPIPQPVPGFGAAPSPAVPEEAGAPQAAAPAKRRPEADRSVKELHEEALDNLMN